MILITDQVECQFFSFLVLHLGCSLSALGANEALGSATSLTVTGHASAVLLCASNMPLEKQLQEVLRRTSLEGFKKIRTRLSIHRLCA